MNTRPPVSCFCLTYGRPAVLEEAIHSFLQQDYAGRKELVILNDYAGQTLIFDHPAVRVINLPSRFRTVGEKMNAAVALAAHDVLFVWDDDDIYLPHRLSLSVDQFEPSKGFFKTSNAWFWNDGVLSGPEQNVFHSASCWSRRLFDAVRGYAAEGTGYDLVFEQRLEEKFPGSIKPCTVELDEMYYLYRWHGTHSYHMSQYGDLEPGKNVGQREVASYVQQQARRGEIPLGPVHLQPHRKADYQKLVADTLAALALQPESTPSH